MLKLWAAGISVACVLAVARPGEVAAACVGDCDGSGMVTVGELVAGVNIATGAAPLDTCEALDANSDLEVSIDELIRAVGYLLDGCPVTATTAGLAFGAENNRLFAYQGAPGFPHQIVIPSDDDAPGVGRDINGQICFTRGPEDQVRFIAGEDTNQGPLHSTAGWGLFELGGAFPNFTWQQIGKIQPTYQPVPEGGDEPENYGCGFLSDGRLLTTDVGSQAAGGGTGQLVIYFPPLYPEQSTLLQVGHRHRDGAADRRRRPGPSVRRVGTHDRSQPGRSVALHRTVPDVRYRRRRVRANRRYGRSRWSARDGSPRNASSQATAISRPRVAVALLPGGGFYIASVVNGVIAEYDADGQFVRRILSPPRPGIPAETGNPIGLGLASDGTLYFSDIGLQLYPGGGIGPGDNLGTVRRIRFVDGVPQPPEIMNQGLNFPDGMGILERAVPTATGIQR